MQIETDKQHRIVYNSSACCLISEYISELVSWFWSSAASYRPQH